MDIDHIYETLTIGIDALAAGTRTIQERLSETWMVIHALEEDDFPLYVRDEFRKLSNALTTPQQSAINADPEGCIVDRAPAACEALDDGRARELALLVAQLFAHVSAELWPNQQKGHPERQLHT
jgi:hypothetical protein